MLLKLTQVFLFFLFSFAIQSQAVTFGVPALSGPVVDQARLLSPEAKQRIESILVEENKKGGPQVQVLTLVSLGDETIETAAIKVFDTWKLGDEKKDNGVLFLIAPTEKKLRIEVGQGLEGNIPDAIAKRIVSDIVVPYFKRGEFDRGVMQGVAAILTYAQDPNQAQAQPVADVNPKGFVEKYLLFFIIGIWLLIFILGGGRRGRGGGGFYGGGGGWAGGGFGGGGFGGGGWSGGGGSSSGGGASGGW